MKLWFVGKSSLQSPFATFPESTRLPVINKEVFFPADTERTEAER